ncbi:FAD-dependent oxidoreductase [Adlercreutzia sp. R21]|uniref:FAD-dependent oxidoreductase n=1 Tax=Adlercreutzia wanghongyangiae TaxID=3111451 RepID=UPI002DC0013C|nr:FAD-dependent oxidoreductase [Adlercreutzia sp. R21]MEC4183263.1 FAD-dependent oxidoreductase [Adlercreutzia sp. R21]
MADFDAIVVGAGCAGSVAAYELAQAGKNVLMIERGNFAGAKNMTGGRIYTHSLERVFPNFREEAPLERRIEHERISLMTEDANFTVDFSSEAMANSGGESYSVLRAPFDQWLASKAEEAGAEVIYGIAVESLVKDDSGKVTGVRAGEDEISAEVVLLCDGVNSLLTEQAVGARRPPASGMAVGVKQTIALPAEVITDRVLATSDREGAAWLISGYATGGSFGGGFVYTNRESISLGVVAGIDATVRCGKTSVCQMLENLKAHPAIAPLIRGGRVVEHSGHMVPEGGIGIMPDLVADGVLLAGECAMMCMNLGYQVRGIDFAIAAGSLAGKTAVAALDTGDTGAQTLMSYVRDLESSFVLKDLRQFRKTPAFLEGFTRMFEGYPEMVRDIMNGLFIVDGTPARPIRKTVAPALKGIGYANLIKDARGAVMSL